jgi:hypothetical protein
MASDLQLLQKLKVGEAWMHMIKHHGDLLLSSLMRLGSALMGLITILLDQRDEKKYDKSLWGNYFAGRYAGKYEMRYKRTKTDSVVWVRERTIPTERSPLVGKVSANFLRIEGATWSAWRIPTAVFSIF